MLHADTPNKCGPDAQKGKAFAYNPVVKKSHYDERSTSRSLVLPKGVVTCLYSFAVTDWYTPAKKLGLIITATSVLVLLCFSFLYRSFLLALLLSLEFD